jgi:hypothetical protein
MAALLACGPASAQQIRKDLYCADGSVNAMVVSGNLLYIGGDFTHLGRATGCGVPIDAVTGLEPSSFAQMVGDVGVQAVVPDGAGGWYIGGYFSSIGGVARSNLAHILADNTVSDWNPGADYGVSALVVSGSTIYVGGTFTNIGGQPRSYIAALDAATGNATAWNPGADAPVVALALQGSIIYAGGGFNTIGGQSRSKIAALDVTIGNATAWNPSAAAGFPSSPHISSLAVDGLTVYAGGIFTSIGFQFRNNIAALDATSGAATAWDPNANGRVSALVIQGSTIYAGGLFTNIGGQTRQAIAALDASTGSATAWNPGAAGSSRSVLALAVSGSTVYAGGSFTNIGGQARNDLAALDATTGSATSWNPSPSGTNGGAVMALGVSGSLVYAGGAFNMLGAQARDRLAALDLTTGAPTSWNPGVDNSVLCLALSGSTLYVGGSYAQIAGQPRNNLGAVDVGTGTATAFAANTDNPVRVLTVNGSTVYAGGSYVFIGGVIHRYLSALDATTGALQPWDPNPNTTGLGIAALTISGSTMYAAGDFTTIGGQSRHGLAALDLSTANATAWNPSPFGSVSAILLNGSTMYVAGGYTFIGGQPRSNLAAVDLTTGAATAFDPGANSGVSTLALNGSILHMTGGFTLIGGQARNHAAALDLTTGFLTPWQPAVGGVKGLAISGSTIYLCGNFQSISGLPNSGLAGTSEVTVGVPLPGPRPGGLLTLDNRPNPFHSSTDLRFSLPRATEVTLGIYDVAGREVIRLVDGRPLDAGPHEIHFDGRGLASAVYVCRLRAGDQSSSRRIVLIP